MPNCPAASATPEISSTDSGISFAIPRIPFLSFESSSLVASTVFVTPVNALSKLIPEFATSFTAVPIPTVAAIVFISPAILEHALSVLATVL